MRARSRHLAACLVATWMLVSWRSLAAPQDRYRLAWHPVGACPSEGEVHARIDRILGSISSSGDVLDADVNVVSDGSTYRAHVTLTSKGQTSSRDVDGDSCSAVADATALIVAIAIDPNAIKNAPSPSPSPSPSPNPNPNPTPTPTPTPRPTPTPTASPDAISPPYFFAGAGYLFDSSTLPGVASGIAADVGWRPRHASFALSGFWLAARDTHLDAKPSEGAGVGAVGLGARGCYELVEDSPVDLAPCGGADVVWLSASGFGSGSPTDASARLFRFTLAGRFSYRVWRLGLFAEAGAAIPLTRPQFVIENSGTVERIAPVSFLGKIGAQLHF